MKINILIIILLVSVAIPTSTKNFLASAGIDFYQFWGVSKAQKLSGHNLKSPYNEHTKYAEILTAYVNRSSDERLKRANNYWGERLKGANNNWGQDMDLTGTPLFYLIFAVLPMNYSFAFGIYQILQIVLFITSMVMLGSIYNEHRSGLLSLTLLLVLIYEPLLSDLRVGNFNSIQLFALVLLIAFARRIGRSAGNHLIPSVLFMSLLVLITLLKPNLSLITLLLSFHLWALSGTFAFSVALVVAVAFCAFLIVLTCLQFNSWMVWIDWFNFLKGVDGTKLFYPVSEGNYASVLLLSRIFNTSSFATTVIIGCALSFSVAGALMMSLAKDKAKMKGLWQSTVRSLRNPHLVVAVGVTATLILSPLVWLHYYLLSLVPAAWLLSLRHRWTYASTAGGLSILLTSNVPVRSLTYLLGDANVMPYSVASGLAPLWIGVLATFVYAQADLNRSDF